MSQWTHIRGGMELVSTPYEKKKSKKELIEPKREDFETDKAFEEAHDKYRWEERKLYYFPYPEEQFKLSMPLPATTYTWHGKDRKNRKEHKSIDFRAYIYSLPRARKYIEEAFKLMPQGELGFRYSVDQKVYDSSSSSSGFWMPCEYKAYQETITRMYKHEHYWGNYTYEDLRKYFHIDKECSVDNVSHILIGVRDDIRYCSAADVQEGLEKCFKYLEDNGIGVEDGYLEWQDEWDSDHIYAWRYSRLSFGIGHQFLILDKKTNKVVHSKTWAAKRDENGKRMHDENWNDIWEVVEKDGPYFDEED